MKLAPLLALTIMLAAGAAAAATQAGTEAPRLLGALAALLGCGGTGDLTLFGLEVLDEAEFSAVLEPWTDAGP